MPIRRVAFLAVIVIASIFQIEQAMACSRGYPQQLTPEEQAAKDRYVLQENEIIVEMTVLSPRRDTPWIKECQLAGKQVAACDNGDQTLACDEISEQFIGKCLSIDVAAQVEVTKVWKGQLKTGENIVNFEIGGFWRTRGDNNGSCSQPIHLIRGDKLIFCGSFGETGEVLGAECQYSRWFEFYKLNWQTLESVAILAPQNLDAQIALAEFLEEGNDRIGALATYERIRQLSPRSPIGYLGAGRVWFADQRHDYAVQRDHFDEAIPFFQQALEHDPTNAEARSFRDRIRFLRGEPINPTTVDFRGMNLRDKNFDNLDLRGKNFGDTTLTNVSFRNAKLDGANFADATFENVSFAGASLRDANFAQLTFSPYQPVHFSLQWFSGADLTGANFRGVDFDLGSASEDAPVAMLLKANMEFSRLWCWSWGPESAPAHWDSYLEDLRSIRQIVKSEANLSLMGQCGNAVIHYLSLPAGCQPWLPEDQRSAECRLLE